MQPFRQISYLMVVAVLLARFRVVDANFNGNKFNFNASRVPEDKQCQPWFSYNTATGNCECINVNMISCIEQDAYLVFGYCASHDQTSQLTFIAECPYFQSRGFNVTRPGYVLLPNNYSDLNKFMCGPMNRKGFVCSDCMDHYGPSVTSYGYQCSKCVHNWQGILLYLLLEFVPITLLFLVILVFQIDLVTPPIPCFIMYCQLVYSGLHYYAADDRSARQVMFTESHTLRLGTKILLSLCGIMNLDFFLYFLPRFCVSSRLKIIHIGFLSYLKALYPLMLILFTWICIKLHNHNFRLIVYLWKPFRRCFVQLRNGWNTRNDIVNAFCSFFLLSYGKCFYQTVVMLNCQCISVISEFKVENRDCPALLDPNIDCWGAQHLPYIIPAILALLICNILPTFLLILYPLKAVKALLSRCGLVSIDIALFHFTEKFYCYYKDHTTYKQNMRHFSSLYFFLMATVYALYIATRHLIGIADHWFTKGVLFLVASLIITTFKPYKIGYMNVLDSLLLAHLSILCNIMSLPSEEYFRSHYVLVVQLLCLLPFAVLMLYIVKRITFSICRALKQNFKVFVRQTKGNPVEQPLLTHPDTADIKYY